MRNKWEEEVCVCAYVLFTCQLKTFIGANCQMLCISKWEISVKGFGCERNLPTYTFCRYNTTWSKFVLVHIFFCIIHHRHVNYSHPEKSRYHKKKDKSHSNSSLFGIFCRILEGLLTVWASEKLVSVIFFKLFILFS